MSKIGTLVFPFSDKGACWETYLSLRESKRFLFAGASSQLLSKTKLCEEHYFISSTVDDDSLPEEVEKLRVKVGAQILIPVHDEVMIRLKPHFRERIPGSGYSSLALCRSKKATYRELHGHVKVPSIFDIPSYPCFLKPDRGQGSRGARLINNKEEYEAHYKPDMLILEYLPGKEYTVDCFTDSKGRLAHCAPRLRVRIEDGIAVETRFVNLPEAITAAEAINDKFNLRGAWFCQFKRDTQGELTLLEVAPRIAGASRINRTELGINLTEWMLIEHLNTS